MTPAERLKQIRKKTGLSQKAFAEMLGVSFNRVNSIESGKQKKIPFDLAHKITEKLPEDDYSFQWIVTGEGEAIDQKEGSEIKGAELLKLLTEYELELLYECIETNKEITTLLLKKLKADEAAVKRFLF